MRPGRPSLGAAVQLVEVCVTEESRRCVVLCLSDIYVDFIFFKALCENLLKNLSGCLVMVCVLLFLFCVCGVVTHFLQHFNG